MITASMLEGRGYRMVGDYYVSPVKPMMSTAGWYAGHYCYELMEGQWVGPMPYDRITGYYLTKEEVEDLIKRADQGFAFAAKYANMGV